MDDETPDSKSSELESRAPVEDDLVAICRCLNELGARYLVCGGFAIIHAGYARFTGDIDLLIDASLKNEAKIYAALEILPDKAVRELKPGEVSEYTVVRIGDEVTVDVMASAGGIGFDEAEPHIVRSELQGVSIPFASPLLLWKMKRHTHREKDRGDLFFLRQILESQGITPPE